MCKLHARFVIIVFSIIILTELSAWAVDESKVVSSAEKVVKRWVELLPKKDSEAVCLKKEINGEYWRVRKFNTVEVSYDVQKTDSIVSPYILTISIWSSYMDNARSPSANGCKDDISKDGWLGFKSEDEALSHTGFKDFFSHSGFYDNLSTFQIYVYYLYREKFWEYKKWTGEEGRFGRKGRTSFYPLNDGVFGGDVKKIDGIICNLGKSEYFSNVLKDIPID